MSLRVASVYHIFYMIISLTQLFNLSTSQILSQTQILTPQSSDRNGAKVLKNFAEVTNINNEWNVEIKYQSTWQFILILDNTWAFDPFRASTITLVINSPSIATGPISTTFDDLVFGFTTDNQEYVSMWIPMDNHGQKNRIYPYCSTDSKSTQPFGIGDIAALPESDRNCDVAGGSCANWNTMQPKNAQNPIVYQTNNFPITFILENNPILDTFSIKFISSTFEQSFIQNCNFISFPTNNGLKIYIGGNDPGQEFIITSFDVTSFTYAETPTSIPPSITPTYKPTNIPTITPTYTPSNLPSITPTKYPSNNPTISPTNIPSIPPTKTPSNNPTIEPTIKPSYNPSISPTYEPTYNPSYIPSNTPSKIPTISPSKFPTITPTKLPSNIPSKTPSKFPTQTPTKSPSYEPTIEPTNKPSEIPTKIPSQTPIIPPTYSPTTIGPSKFPTITPTYSPTYIPSIPPSNTPTYNPTTLPTLQPLSPTYNPTYLPSIQPTLSPIQSPSISPTISPTLLPSANPTFVPTIEPTTNQPSTKPTDYPTIQPTSYPTATPTYNPITNKPTHKPTPIPVYMWHPTTESPTNYPTITPTNIPTKITNIPTIIPTNIPTATQIINENNNNNQIVYKPRQFGDIILPVTLVVLVGACALCCVVIVIIRQLCIKSQRATRKPHKYITAIQVTPQITHENSEKKHGPLSDTDSIDAQHIHHVHHIQPIRHKDISNAGANNIMMDDIIEEINTRGHTEIELRTNSNNSDNIMNNKRSTPKGIIVKSGNYKPKYKYTYSEEYNTNVTDMSTKCNYGSIERKMMDNNYDMDDDDAGSNNSDDTQLSKPRRHNYSTLTMKSGIAIANEIKQDIDINKGYKYIGHGHANNRHPNRDRDRNAYHDITASGFGKLQNAITVAKTHSDFDKLEDLIKKGIIPSPNWHGKGQNYNRYKYDNNNTINELNEMEEKDYIKHNNQNTIINDSESSLMSKSESSVENNNNINQSINIGKEILENKIVILDEDELTHKLVNVKNDRKLKQKQKKKRIVRHRPIEQQYID